MATSYQAAVTPDGIRDGAPAALAALVERRANAVLAYCEAVCAPPAAERAAAEAFARFRAAVAAAAEPRSLDPEGLLLGATRHAAASMTTTPYPPPATSGLRRKLGAGRGSAASETCALVPGLLAARVEGALGAADQERLTRHLERHAACRALADAVDRAEGAYASPPARTLPIGALSEIMLALASAAPLTAAPGAELVFADVAFPDAEPGAGFAPGADTELDGDFAPEADTELREELAFEGDAGDPDFVPGADSDHEGEPALGPAPAIVMPAAGFAATAAATGPEEVDDGAGHQSDLDHTLVLPAAAATVAPAGGIAHPRPPRGHLHLPGTGGEHGVVFRYVLPGAFVAAALVAVMGVAGVFAVDESAAPVALPAATGPAAPPAGAPPVTSATDAAAAAAAAGKQEALVAQRRARRERAAAARRRARQAAAATAAATTQTETTPPAVVLPEPEPAPARAASTPRPTPAPTPARRKPAKPASTAKKEPPAESSSALPQTGTAPAPSADPGVFEGTPAPTP